MQDVEYVITQTNTISTYFIVQDILWKADSHSTCQTIACFLCGTRRFITVLMKTCHWILSWASQIQFAPSIPISLRSILMLSSHLLVDAFQEVLHQNSGRISCLTHPSQMLPLDFMTPTTIIAHNMHKCRNFRSCNIPNL